MAAQAGIHLSSPLLPIAFEEGMGEHSSLKWYALNVRRRMERVAATCLEGKGYEYLLPVQRVKTQWSDRVKESERALFPGYIFCRFDARERVPLLTTPGVLSIVGFGKELVPVMDFEMEALARIVNSQQEVQPCAFVAKGEKVEIMAGPLKGLQGLVTEAGNGLRVIVSVELLQRSVSVHVQSTDIRPCR
jgi:transcription antitermination factor NusG